MRVYVVRHGLAVDQEASLSDPQRYLSDKGRRSLRQVGRVLREQAVQLDALLTSPLVRAVQTAELLAEALSFLEIVEVLPTLHPGVPVRLCAAELPSRGAQVAVVGHEPGLAALSAYLCGRPAFPPFRPGQVVCLEDGRPCWSLNPETLALDRLLLH